MLVILELFSFLIIFLGFLIILSNSPIFSILFLIVIFCNAGFTLFFFNFDFFGLIFIIIYVGAIAVLFLFIIMMLNVKVQSQSFYNDFKNILFSGVVFFLSVLLVGICFGSLLEYCIVDEALDLALNRNNLIFNNIDKSYNITVFGQYFYNFFNIDFILAGLILLIALVGAVSLTIDSSVIKIKSFKQTEFRQLSKSANVLSFYN